MHNYQDKRQLLIDTTIYLVNRQGMENTSTAQITAEAGVATGTLYTYFKSKEKLMEACYDHCCELNYEYCINGLDALSCPMEKLIQRAVNAMYWGINNPELLQFQLSGHIKRSFILENRDDEHKSDIYMLMEEAQKKGLTKNLPCELLVEMELGVMGFALSYAYRHREECKKEGFIREMVEAAIDCVRI